MLYRWSEEEENSLKDDNYLKNLTYDRRMLSGTAWEQAGMEYNIFCLHTVWNTEEVQRTLGITKGFLLVGSVVYDNLCMDPFRL